VLAFSFFPSLAEETSSLRVDCPDLARLPGEGERSVPTLSLFLVALR